MKAKSVSCSNLMKQIEKEYASTKKQAQSQNSQFIPFCSERRLGKLIRSNQKTLQSITARRPSDQELIQKINFKNFHKIYQTVMHFQNKRYSELTRKPDQRNLINQEWRLNSISKISQKSKVYPNTSRTNRSNEKDKIVKKEGSNFQKMDEYLFKKMSLVREPKNNPELQDMYNNYIKICEINENIKRAQLTGQRKPKLF